MMIDVLALSSLSRRPKTLKTKHSFQNFFGTFSDAKTSMICERIVAKWQRATNADEKFLQNCLYEERQL